MDFATRKLAEEIELRKRRDCPFKPYSFVNWVTARGGYRIFAQDYGIQAFPIRNRAFGETGVVARPSFQPILNGSALRCGSKDGDWVLVPSVGEGRVIAVDDDVLVVQMESGFPMVWKGHEKRMKEFEIRPACNSRRRAVASMNPGQP